MTKSARITKIKKCNKNCVLSIPTGAPSTDMLLFGTRHLTLQWDRQLDEKEAVLFGGPGNGWAWERGGCNTGGKGRVVMRGIISHTFHFMYYFDSLRYQCFSRNTTRATRYRRGPRPGHNTNTGEMSHLPVLSQKGRWAPAVSSSLLLSWPSPSCPGHGYLVIIWR